jgi:hypothetical protein
LRRKTPSLDADLDVIIRIADEKHAKVIEEFFDALPEGQVRTPLTASSSAGTPALLTIARLQKSWPVKRR